MTSPRYAESLEPLNISPDIERLLAGLERSITKRAVFVSL